MALSKKYIFLKIAPSKNIFPQLLPQKIYFFKIVPSKNTFSELLPQIIKHKFSKSVYQNYSLKKYLTFSKLLS